MIARHEAAITRNPHLDQNEVGEVIAHMLFHGAACVEMRADLAIDFVPGPADLFVEITPQRRQILIQTLGPAIALKRHAVPGRTFAVWNFVIAQLRARRMTTAEARTLNNNFKHVLTHEDLLPAHPAELK